MGGSAVSSPSVVRGEVPANAFWCILSSIIAPDGNIFGYLSTDFTDAIRKRPAVSGRINTDRIVIDYDGV